VRWTATSEPINWRYMTMKKTTMKNLVKGMEGIGHLRALDSNI
jgi:hypothetical protein